MYLKPYLNLWAEAPNSKFPPYHVWFPLVQCKWKYDIFNCLFDLTIPRDWGVMWRYGWETLIVNYHSAKFGSYMHCRSRDMAFLICYLIYQDHVTQKPCNFISRNTFRWNSILSNFVGQRLCGCGVITILVCQVILQYQVIKESCDVLVREPLR